MKYFLLRISLILFFFKGFTQTSNPADGPGPYKAGYRNIITIDPDRIYKANTDSVNPLHFRPVEIDFWYPALRPGKDSSIRYGYFLDLLQQRSNRFQDDTVYRQMGSELVTYLRVNLKIKDTALLTHLPTSSFMNAVPVPQRFPLVLYFCSYNGMSYENLPSFERLAAHGYLVACITSVGKYPGNMSTRVSDLMEQVRDGDFALRYLKKEQNLDTMKTGVMGYSWGGLAAAILAMNSAQVRCILSLDGSEIHYYGDSKEEDHDFDQLRNSTYFNAKKLNIPYAYLESGFKQSDEDADSIFNTLRSADVQNNYVHFPKAVHEDFSCFPFLGNKIDETNPKVPDLYSRFQQFALYFFDQYLKGNKNELQAFLDTVYRNGTGDKVYPFVRTKKKGLLLEGTIADDKTRERLAFVNVGIRNKNTGTVSAPNGSFQLKMDSVLMADSLIFSMAGYQSLVISISDLLHISKPIAVSLKEKISELKEVVITSKAMKTEVRGNTTTSNFINIGLPLRFLGSETGIRLSLGKNPVLLKSFSFNISDNRVDTAVFRLNIYSMKMGVPFENILHQNILVPVGKQKGKYTLNLNDYKLVLKGAVLLSLELIEGSYKRPGSGALFLSAGFLNSATWHRLTSQAEWKKATGLGVGFNVVVQKFQN